MAKFKYRLWCSTENDYVYVWADTPPTQCPNDGAHSIDTDKTAYVQTREEIVIDPNNGPDLLIKSPDGNTLEKLTLNNDGTFNLGSNKVNLNGSNEISVTFTDSQRPYIRRTSSTYGVMAYILFSGTTELGDPASINALAWSKSASKNYSLKIIRHDTGDQLCELTDQNNSDIEIKDLGTITNLPTTPTILEIHGKCDNGGECRISSVLIKF